MQDALAFESVEDVSLADETRRRYLNYALSVITSRALPDVRDGLKPVHRRILYTMWNELRLKHGTRHRKSAAIVGDVMGKFHPHGDTAIYDALVRMAQPFSMGLCLVDGRGNFGSPDGDGAAAMRYTEARLGHLAEALMTELGSDTVGFRPNYDGTRTEPVVFPAQFPNLLVNGCQGIAVGMATSIPPHSLGEVVDAAMALIDDPELPIRKLMRWVKGPDFPTGGELVCTKDELEQAYTDGHGSLRLRGQWKVESERRVPVRFVITSAPYGVERQLLVERIADVILSKKFGALVDVRDESDEECRIVCEFKKGTDPELIAAYLYKHTPFSQNVAVNMTCLVPVQGAEVCAPRRVGLKTVLQEFLAFRMEVVTRRLTHDLEQLTRRIHILEGFEIIFDALDETIRIIRRSEGKADAAAKLIKRFQLEADQVDAILELKLYRLAKLEILVIQKELKERRSAARKLQQLLKSKDARWGLIKSELSEVRATYGVPRRTALVRDAKDVEFSQEDFIADEDAVVVCTDQGWLKRQQRVKDVESVRVRSGDRVWRLIPGSVRSSLMMFSSRGVAYTTRIADVPATSGHGQPAQTLVKFGDGERIVEAMGTDPRVFDVPEVDPSAEQPEAPFGVAISRQGQVLRFSLRGFRAPSTRSGRRFMRVSEEPEDGVVGVHGGVDEDAVIVCVTAKGRALLCSVSDVPVVGGAAKGVRLIRLAPDDGVVATGILVNPSDALRVRCDSGRELTVTLRKYEVVGRGGKGFALVKRGHVQGEVPVAPAVVDLPERTGSGKRK